MVGVQEIVHDIMNPDPAYYAGRGNMEVDLDSDKLERIAERVYCEGDLEAVSAFVEMVRDLTEKDDMSATTFLTALGDLIRNQWKYSGNAPSTERAVTDAIENSGYPDSFKHDLRIIASFPSSPSVVSALKIAGEFLCVYSGRNTQEIDTGPADIEVIGPHTARLRTSRENRDRHGGSTPQAEYKGGALR